MDEDDGISDNAKEEEEQEEIGKVELEVPLPPTIQTSIREIQLDKYNMFKFISKNKI